MLKGGGRGTHIFLTQELEVLVILKERGGGTKSLQPSKVGGGGRAKGLTLSWGGGECEMFWNCDFSIVFSPPPLPVINDWSLITLVCVSSYGLRHININILCLKMT